MRGAGLDQSWAEKNSLTVADDPIDFIIPQFGKHRQGDILSGVAFCFGK